MVAFSSLIGAAKWLLVPASDDPKHREIWHPLISSLLGIILTYKGSGKLAQILENRFPELKDTLPIWS